MLKSILYFITWFKQKILHCSQGCDKISIVRNFFSGRLVRQWIRTFDCSGGTTFNCTTITLNVTLMSGPLRSDRWTNVWQVIAVKTSTDLLVFDSLRENKKAVTGDILLRFCHSVVSVAAQQSQLLQFDTPDKGAIGTAILPDVADGDEVEAPPASHCRDQTLQFEPCPENITKLIKYLRS